MVRRARGQRAARGGVEGAAEDRVAGDGRGRRAGEVAPADPGEVAARRERAPAGGADLDGQVHARTDHVGARGEGRAVDRAAEAGPGPGVAGASGARTGHGRGDRRTHRRGAVEGDRAGAVVRARPAVGGGRRRREAELREPGEGEGGRDQAGCPATATRHCCAAPALSRTAWATASRTRASSRRLASARRRRVTTTPADDQPDHDDEEDQQRPRDRPRVGRGLDLVERGDRAGGVGHQRGEGDRGGEPGSGPYAVDGHRDLPLLPRQQLGSIGYVGGVDREAAERSRDRDLLLRCEDRVAGVADRVVDGGGRDVPNGLVVPSYETCGSTTVSPGFRSPPTRSRIRMASRRSTFMPGGRVRLRQGGDDAAEVVTGSGVLGQREPERHLDRLAGLDPDLRPGGVHPGADAGRLDVLGEQVELSAVGGEPVGGVDRQVDRLLAVVDHHEPVADRAARVEGVAVVLPVRPELVGGGPDRPGDVVVGRDRRTGSRAEERDGGEQGDDDGAGDQAGAQHVVSPRGMWSGR